MYLSVIIRHILIPSLSRSKKFYLRSFRSLSFNGIWLNQNPTNVASLDGAEQDNLLRRTYPNGNFVRSNIGRC
jgi:hypothetical protein